MSKSKDFITYLLTEISQEQSRSPISSHDPGYIYLIKTVGYHGIVPGFYLGRYKIGLSRDPNTRIESFYDNQPPCDLEIVTTIRVTDMKIVEAILHKRFNDCRIKLKRKRTSEWFDFSILRLWQVKRAYSRLERHPLYGTVTPRRLSQPASIVLILVSLLALSAAGNYFLSQRPVEQLDGSSLTDEKE